MVDFFGAIFSGSSIVLVSVGSPDSTSTCACLPTSLVPKGLQQLCVIYRRCSPRAELPNRSHRRARHWHTPASAAFAEEPVDRLAGPPIRRPDSSGFDGLRLQLSRRTTDYLLRSRLGCAPTLDRRPPSALNGRAGVAPAADIPPNPVVVVFGVEQNQKPFAPESLRAFSV